MGILKTTYNEEKRLDRTWYQSSNVIYSEFVESATENIGDLTVVFKAGKSYLYENVSYQDYLMFKHGLQEESSGKSLHKYIITKYQGIKQEDRDLDKILKEKDEVATKDDTHFIYGDADLTSEEFENNCIPRLLEFLTIAVENKNAHFIVIKGDKCGEKTVEFLTKELLISEDRIQTFENNKENIDKALSMTKDNLIFVSEKVLEKIQDISLSIYAFLRSIY